jgi:hypothetical protein
LIARGNIDRFFTASYQANDKCGVSAIVRDHITERHRNFIGTLARSVQANNAGLGRGKLAINVTSSYQSYPGLLVYN